MLQYAKKKAISLSLLVSKKRLQQLCQEAGTLIPSALDKPPSVLEDYYEPSEVELEDLMSVFPGLLNRQYQKLSTDKLQQIRQLAIAEEKERAKQAQTFESIQIQRKIRALRQKKQELLENNFLLKAEIDSQQHRIDIAGGRIQYLKHCRQMVIKEQISDIERQFDKELKDTVGQLENLSFNYRKQLEIIQKSEVNHKIQSPQTASIDLAKYQISVLNIQKEYEIARIKAANKIQNCINSQKEYIEGMLKQHEKQLQSQSNELNSTIKQLKSLPSAPNESEMKNLLIQIEKDKKYIDKRKAENNRGEDKKEINRIKHMLKLNISKFQEMIEMRQKLKQTLKL